MKSIHRYLSFTLLAAITLITFTAAIKGYNTSMNQATEIFDADLRSIAQTLAHVEPAKSQATIPVDSNLSFQIWHHGELLMRSDNSPVSPMGQFSKGFSEDNFLGQRWRIYSASMMDDEKWVMVAQPLSHRYELADNMVVAAVFPLIISIPLLAIAIAIIVKQGLAPLRQLTRALDNKKADDLTAIELRDQPAELAKVTTTLNHLFQRLEDTFKRERRFAADAAHELRTPISVLQINAHNLQQELHSKVDQESLQGLQAGVERMGHVIDQMLMLNRTNPEKHRNQFATMAVDDVIREVISDLYPTLQSRGQSITLNAEKALFLGDEFGIGIMMKNLIDNASKYAGAGKPINVSVCIKHSALVLSVEDGGRGIAPEQRERIFERFYRVGGDRHQTDVVGCGLGLAIVCHIVQLHRGQIVVDDSEQLGGARFTVTFNQ